MTPPLSLRPPAAGLVTIVMSLLLLLLALGLSRGGILHPEAHAFIPHYLSTDRSLAQIIFDPAGTDFGMYQARELSYLFDWLDCHFMALSASLGHPHFLSVTHFVMAVLASIILWLLGRLAGLGDWGRALVVLLFLSSPMIMLGGGYFRSAKIGVALNLVTAVWLYLGIVGPAERHGLRVFPRAAALLAVLVCAGLFDRQGFFLCLVACALQTLRALALRQTREYRLLGLFAAAVVLLLAYNHLIAPRLIEAATGRPPSLAFQSVMPASLEQLRRDASLLFLHGPVQVFRYAGAFLGSLPWPVVAAGWLALTATAWTRRPRPKAGEPPARNLAALAMSLWPLWLGLALMFMTALMVRHIAALLFPELTIAYYPLPLAALAAAGTTVFAARLRGRQAKLALAILALLTGSNLLLSLDHRRTQERGVYAASYEISRELLPSLRAAHGLSPSLRYDALLTSLPENCPPAALPALLALLDVPSDPSAR